jgi:hypothetical protein
MFARVGAGEVIVDVRREARRRVRAGRRLTTRLGLVHPRCPVDVSDCHAAKIPRQFTALLDLF